MESVAMLLPSLGTGGIRRIMLNLGNAFCHWGISVDYVLVKPRGNLLGHVPQGARVVDLGASRALLALPRLVRYLCRREPDVLHTGHEHLGVLALMARGISGTSTRVVPAVHRSIAISAPMEETVTGRLAPLAARFAYQRAHRVVAVSEGVARETERTLKVGRDRIAVIGNPVLDGSLKSKATESSPHPWLEADDLPTVLSAGRLVPEKDFPTLLEAVANVREQAPARLIVLGDGPERGNLERLVKQLGLSTAVDLPGFVANPYPYMKRADLYVQSSITEGFGVALVEALALGTPVVSTDCPHGPRDILEGGRWGQLVAPNDPEGLAAAILGSLRAEPSYSRADLNRSLNRFRVKTVAREYLKVFADS